MKSRAVSSCSCCWLFVVVALVACGCVLVIAVADITGNLNPSALLETRRAAVKTVTRLCRNVHNIKNVADMDTLIGELKTVIDFKDFAQRNSFFRPLLPDPSWPCIVQAQVILDLKPILSEKKNVCKSSHIGLIEAYKRKHFGFPYMSKTRVTKRFFRLYANQVAMICMRNLLHNLNQIHEKHLIGDENYASVTYWLPTKEECKSSFDLYRDRRSFEPAATGIEARCNALKTLSEVKNVDDLADMLALGQGSREDNSMDARQRVGRETEHEPDEEPETEMSDTMRKGVQNMLVACGKLERIYSHTVMPIVRMIELGFNPPYDKFQLRCQKEEIIQRWLKVTLICSSLLSSKLAADGKVQRLSDIKDLDDEITRSLVYEMDDELWVADYLPTRRSKLKALGREIMLRIIITAVAAIEINSSHLGG